MLQIISKLLDPLHHPLKIIAGDFNMITNLSEKKGRIWKLGKESKAFLATIENLNLIGIPTSNGLFTSNNRRGGDHQIASCLDRFILSEAAYLTSWETEARILPQAGPNHWHISLKIQISIGPKNKPFRFGAFLLDHQDFMDKMKQSWTYSPIRTGNKMYTFQQKLKTHQRGNQKMEQRYIWQYHHRLKKKKLEHQLELLQHKII